MFKKTFFFVFQQKHSTSSAVINEACKHEAFGLWKAVQLRKKILAALEVTFEAPHL